MEGTAICSCDMIQGNDVQLPGFTEPDAMVFKAAMLRWLAAMDRLPWQGGLPGHLARVSPTDRKMISQKAKYALRALIALAKSHGDDGTQFISDIAEEQRIPKKFLEQILLDLKHHGIVASRRGKAGGYMLLKGPSAITFGEVLRIVDGPIAPLPCLSRMAYRRCEDCRDEEGCEVRRVFARVADTTRRVLDGTTIADCIDSSNQTADLYIA